MSWVGIISAAASLLGSSMQADSAKGAGGDQAAATRSATDEQRRQFNLIRSDQAPYRDSGVSSLARLRDLLGFGDGSSLIDKSKYQIGERLIPASAVGFDPEGYLRSNPDVAASNVYADDPLGHFKDWGQKEDRNMFVPIYDEPALDAAIEGARASGPYSSLSKNFSVADFWADPVTQLSYQAGLDQGTKALHAAAPLTTGRDSGAAIKDLTKFATDYTGMKAGESFGRFEGTKTNEFNRLATMAGIGQTANQASGAAGANAASNIASLISGQGNAAAASRIAQGNAWSSGITNIANWYQQQQFLNSMNNRGGSGSSNPYTYGSSGYYGLGEG